MEIKESAAAYRAQPQKLTYQDYLEFPDDRYRREIIAGELYMSPSPVPLHQRILLKIAGILSDFVEKSQLGDILISPIDVVLGESDIVIPDIIYISSENIKILTTTNIQGSPDLIIEILSRYNPSNDTVRKKALYEQYGVKEYWIVDPQDQSVIIYSLVEGKFELSQQSEQKGTLRSVVLKGLEIELESVFKK